MQGKLIVKSSIADAGDTLRATAEESLRLRSIAIFTVMASL